MSMGPGGGRRCEFRFTYNPEFITPERIKELLATFFPEAVTDVVELPCPDGYILYDIDTDRFMCSEPIRDYGDAFDEAMDYGYLVLPVRIGDRQANTAVADEEQDDG